MGELRDRRVLVTGSDGFIGSHLVERLVDEGAWVRALGLYNPNGSHGWLDDLAATAPPGLEPVLGDVRDSGLVDELVADADVVMHLAALVSIPYSYEAPRSVLDTNVGGTLNVLEAVRRHGTPRLVHTSTSEVYGTPEHLPITESHPLRGQSPYSASKIAADKFCEAYAASYATPVVVLRPFNTYGPRQSLRAVLPTIVAQLLAGARRVRLGSLHPRRDLTYVSDTVDAFCRAATADLAPGEVVHLGTGTSVSIAELFEACCEAVGVDAEVHADPDRERPEASEVQVLESDPSRAEALLGWKATVDLVEGVRETVEWMRGRVSASIAARYHR